MKSPNFDALTKEEAVAQLKEIRNSLIGVEDAEDAVLWLCEYLDVDPSADADNEFSE